MSEPNKWPVRLFARMGTNQPFMRAFMMHLPELLSATSIHEPKRKEVLDAIGNILMEGYAPAFESLRQIRSYAGVDVPELNRRQAFETFAITLWRAYRDRTTVATRAAGLELKFIGYADNKFVAGLETLRTVEGLDFPFFSAYLTQQRPWQQALSEFRNEFVEHRGDHDDQKFAAFYETHTAEDLFERAWRASYRLVGTALALKVLGSGVKFLPFSAWVNDPSIRSFEYLTREQWEREKGIGHATT